METKPIVTLDDFDDKTYGEGALAASDWLKAGLEGNWKEFPQSPYEVGTDEYITWSDALHTTLDDAYNADFSEEILHD